MQTPPAGAHTRDLCAPAHYPFRALAHTRRMFAFFRPWLFAAMLVLLTAAATATASAETLHGTPLLRRFLAADYNASPQHFAIATGAVGARPA